MKKICTLLILLFFLPLAVSADFMFQKTEPYCSLTGTTHTSFPGEISDTSSWSIPTVYQEECDQLVELKQGEKDRIYAVMIQIFQSKGYMGPVYGGENGYGGSDTLNPEGQKFINEKLFPAMIQYIQRERQKESPKKKNIAVLHYAVSIVGYDYFISQP